MHEIDNLRCWRCGHPLDDEPLPLARAAACPQCAADLHVCRLCEFFDPRVANECREPVAERVVNKERANFCGYLKPRPDAYVAADAAQGAAARGLEALFGLDSGAAKGSPGESSAARSALDELFRKD